MRNAPRRTDAAIERAVFILRRGGLVAFPTETVYGLGADAGNEAAVRRIFEVKGRPADHPLIVHLPDATHLTRWAVAIPEAATALAAAFWPGPLTLVLRRAEHVLDAVTGGQDTIGLRVPYHSVALDLLQAFDGGIAAPSANRFGHLSPTSAADVRTELGQDVDLVLDGGLCEVGIESTIVDMTGPRPRLLRPGGLRLAAIAEIVGRDLVVAGSDAPRAPGRLVAHYSPRTEMALVDSRGFSSAVRAHLRAGQRVAVFSRQRAPLSPDVIELPAPTFPGEYAHVMYRALRRLDEADVDLILVEAVPDGPEWMAVRDRLARASRRDFVDDEP